MSYSSALFRELPAAWPDFAAAQHRKIDRLLDLARVGPGTRLLEIGTGWGELALRAADRGAQGRDGHPLRRSSGTLRASACSAGRARRTG